VSTDGIKGVWRSEPQARWFFAAHLQNALGTGAGYVALLVLAYDRLGSAWGATAVLLADLIPAMLLGPALGRLIDRHGRLRSAIAADLIGALAFAGIVFAHGAIPLIALALVAGVGSALFRPATCALLPGIVGERRLGAANGLFGAMRETGQLLGPALAAGLLLLAGPELIIGFNAVTFAASVLLLSRLRGHVRPVATCEEDEHEAMGSVRSLLREPIVRSLVGTSGAVMLVAGATNVAELVIAQRDLGAGSTGFALLVSAFGCGMLAGSLLGARNDTCPRDSLTERGRDDEHVTNRYLTAIALLGLGLLGTGAAPALPFAMLAFAVAGAGNGLFLVTVRVLMQRLIPERLHGRAFGLQDAVDSWGFGAAILTGGALAASLGGRATFLLAGAFSLIVLFAAARAVSATRPALHHRRTQLNREEPSWAASGN
jgi:MFS family permease